MCWPQLSVDSAHRSVPTSVNRVSTEHRSHNCNPSVSFLLCLSLSLHYFFSVGFCGDLARFLSFLPPFLRLSGCFFPFIHAPFLFFPLSLLPSAPTECSARSIPVVVFPLPCPPDSRLPRVPECALESFCGYERAPTNHRRASHGELATRSTAIYRNRIKAPRRRDNSTGNGRECGL